MNPNSANILRNIARVNMLAILLVFALPAHAQAPIAIQNPSFEVGGAALGAQGWNYGPVPNWTFTGLGPFGLTNVTTAPDGGTTVWSNGGTFSQDLGVTLQAGQIYTASVYLSNRYDGLKPTASLTLLAGAKEICTASFAPTAPAFTFVQMTLACPTPAVIPAGNLTIKFGSDSRQILFDKVSLTSAPSVPPQPDSVQIHGQLKWCAKCDGSDNVPAAGNLLISQTGGGQESVPINPDGTVGSTATGAPFTFDISLDPLEFVLSLTDANGAVQPGASLKLTFPRFELNSAGFTLGNVTLGIVRIAHTVDDAGNPAVRIVDVSAFSLGK